MLEFQIWCKQSVITNSMIEGPTQSCENKWCFAPEYSLMNNFSGKCVAPWVVTIGGKADGMR